MLVSTHSIECVRAFLHGADEADSAAAVFHPTLVNGKLDSRRLDAEPVESLETTGVAVRPEHA